LPPASEEPSPLFTSPAPPSFPAESPSLPSPAPSFPVEPSPPSPAASFPSDPPSGCLLTAVLPRLNRRRRLRRQRRHLPGKPPHRRLRRDQHPTSCRPSWPPAPGPASAPLHRRFRRLHRHRRPSLQASPPPTGPSPTPGNPSPTSPDIVAPPSAPPAPGSSFPAPSVPVGVSTPARFESSVPCASVAAAQTPAVAGTRVACHFPARRTASVRSQDQTAQRTIRNVKPVEPDLSCTEHRTSAIALLLESFTSARMIPQEAASEATWRPMSRLYGSARSPCWEGRKNPTANHVRAGADEASAAAPKWLRITSPLHAVPGGIAA